MLPFVSDEPAVDGRTFCNTANGYILTIFVDRNIYKGATGGPLNFSLWACLEAFVGGGHSPSVLSYMNRFYFYRAPLMPQAGTGCILTRGWHNLVYSGYVDPSLTYTGYEEDWCAPPNVIPVLLHGVGS
jgi:hypothetical protein